MKNKYAEYVRTKLSDRDILEQLAEECSELAQASLKLIRANGYSKNKTPKTFVEALDNFYEECMDVMAVMTLYTSIMPTTDEGLQDYWKYKRWAERLGYKEVEENGDDEQ